MRFANGLLFINNVEIDSPGRPSHSSFGAQPAINLRFRSFSPNKNAHTQVILIVAYIVLLKRILQVCTLWGRPIFVFFYINWGSKSFWHPSLHILQAGLGHSDLPRATATPTLRCKPNIWRFFFRLQGCTTTIRMGLEIQLIISVRYLIPSVGRWDFANFGWKHGVSRFEPTLFDKSPRLFWGPFQTQHLLISRQTAEHLAVIDLSFNGKVGELSMENFSKTKKQTRHQLHPKNPLKHHKCDVNSSWDAPS